MIARVARYGAIALIADTLLGTLIALATGLAM
jgi:hypothetical protein